VSRPPRLAAPGFAHDFFLLGALDGGFRHPEFHDLRDQGERETNGHRSDECRHKRGSSTHASHTERGKVRAAYNRAERLAERRSMMQRWADYLDGLRNRSD